MSITNTTHLIAKEAQDLSMESDEALITLFELEYNSTTYRFHSENSSEAIQFGGNSYLAFPMEVSGIETTSEGASNRPNLSLPNVNSLLRSDSEIPLNNLEDLLGSRLTLRKTLFKYITLGSGSSPSNSYEFKKSIYVLDRITSKNQLMVVFELASPFDLAGARIPARQVTGKYCPWYYRGYATGNLETRSACDWDTLVREDKISTISATDPVRGMQTSSGTMGLSFNSSYDGQGTNADGSQEQFEANRHFNLPATTVITNVLLTDPNTALADPAKFTISLSKGAAQQANSHPNGYAITNITVTHPGSGYSVGNVITLPSRLWHSGTDTSKDTVSYLRMSVTAVTTVSAEVYFSIDDEPFVPETYLNSLSLSTHNSSQQFAEGVFAKDSNGEFYLSTAAVPANNPLQEVSVYWKKVRPFTIWNTDAVGKTYSVNSLDDRKSSYVYYTFNDPITNTVKGNIWKAIQPHNRAADASDGSKINPPGLNSLFWVSADVCGKLLSSCKARYQSRMIGNTSIVTDTSTTPNTTVQLGWGSVGRFDTKIGLPFGGFPGTRKFR
tara:strand:- start:17757 stop:19424 length:1668 start_codon:yes stop_codon:yes gene_type:complete